GLGHFPPNWDETEWYQPRRYEVPAELINYGDENLIAIRVYDNGGGGGMHAGPLGPVEVVE
ncbi:MAG: glycoside hydrolase, partial [Planctomycetota bacterium]